ncbi:MAG: ATP-binding cassette domain-containing protein [Theionarchaea archaeon]|nr:ATP-binding cassette domain-containing protein [Theionarchaea archaeon]
MIKTINLCKYFDGVKAVDGVTFSVGKGEIFGFLGPNGAGKTTTIDVLCTLLTPTSGEAEVNGYDVTKNPNEVRKSIGLIFQEPSLDDRLTAEENLDFHGMIYDVPKDTRTERKKELLNMVDLWDRRKDVVRTYSGGMKRRLEIARGLLHQPKILFLDEPTLGLDPQTRSHIWEYVHNLREEQGITIFMTTHYMDEAENCDRIAIVDHGKVVALDTPDNLKKLVGGDVITIKTINDEKAEKEIGEQYNLHVRRDASGIHLEIENSEEFIPRFISSFSTKINSIHLRRPTLDDVFLKLTGHEIRDEEASAKDQMKTRMRMRGGH